MTTFTSAAARTQWLYRFGLFGLLIVVSLAGLCFGAVELSVSDVVRSLVYGGDEMPAVVIRSIRGPRILLGLMVGAALATSGTLMQGLFRNPLADPSLIGISAGAALGAAVIIVLGGPFIRSLPPVLGPSLLSIAAFLGALVGGLFLQAFASSSGRVDVSSLLLAGIAINAISLAVMGSLQYVASDEELRSLTFWAMGSLGGGTWLRLSVIGPAILVCLFAARSLAGSLDAMLLGEQAALHLGVDVRRIRTFTLILTCLLVGASVAICGMISFVGLIVPHTMRSLLGPGHKQLIVAAALAGATLLVGADVLARVVAAPQELPIGVVTSLMGGPFFLMLMWRRRT